MASHHPLHPTHSGKNECDAVAVAVLDTTEPRCSNCREQMFSLTPAFICQLCNFFLCCACDRGYKHPVHHEHKLYSVNPLKRSSGPWRCNVCKITSLETQCYHCPLCVFNMCKNCFLPATRPLHGHPLTRTDVRKVYHETRGEWCCDICRNNNGPGNYYPWHCKPCRFDLCDNCCKPWRTSFHPGHDLFKADSNIVYSRFSGGWRCDKCHRSFTPPYNNQPYHCLQCEFDLCDDCMRNDGNPSNNVGFDVCRPRMESTQVPLLTRGTTTTRGNPVTSPVDDLIGQKEQIGRPGPTPDDAGECVICLDKPKDATIVHGATGHVCCCTSCAMELQRKGSHCPICRAPIDRVIRQYTV